MFFLGNAIVYQEELFSVQFNICAECCGHDVTFNLILVIVATTTTYDPCAPKLYNRKLVIIRFL